MQKNALLSALLAMACLLASTAQAANTWLPDFDANTHVYVQDTMQKRIEIDHDFADKVQAAGAVHGLSVYVIITEQGDELSMSNRVSWAPDMLHTRLWNQWRGSPGFSEDRILILLYIRAKDSDTGCTGVRCGSYLHARGLDRNRFSSDSGPVMPAVKLHMRNNPQFALLTILDNINNEASRASDGGRQTPNPFLSEGWLGWPIWVWVVLLGGASFILFCWLISKLAKGGGGGGGSGCGGASCTSASCSGGASCGGGGCGGGGCGGG